MPKRKKQFDCARSIIAYSGSTLERLLASTASVLEQLYQKAFGRNQFGYRDNLKIWSDLHDFLQEMPMKQYALLNDDLVGFFTSIPQEDITAAVNYCLQLYVTKFPPQQGNTTNMSFTVDDTHHAQDVGAQFRTFRGKWWTAKSTVRKTIRLQDIIPIVQLSIKSNVFTCIGRFWQQIRGTAIGNQISPILSLIVVRDK